MKLIINHTNLHDPYISTNEGAERELQELQELQGLQELFCFDYE